MTEEEREDLEITLKNSYRNHIRPKLVNCLCFSRDLLIILIVGLLYVIYITIVYILNMLFQI